MVGGSIRYREYLENISELHRLTKVYESEKRKAEQAGEAEYNDARRRQQMFDGKWREIETRLEKLSSRIEKIKDRTDLQAIDTISIGLLLRDVGDIDSALTEIAVDIEHCEQSLAWIERNSI